MWHAYRAEEKEAFEKVVAQYNASPAAKGNRVTTLAVPYDAFADKITAAVPRGKGPDIFIYAQDRLGGWIEAGNTVDPIDFFLDKPTRDRFIPTTLQAMTYKGTVYGLPLNYKVITMIYNKKLVTAPPRTSGELVATAKKLTNLKAGRFGLAYSYADFYYHACLMNGFGGRVFDAQNRPVLNNPQNVQVDGAPHAMVREGQDPSGRAVHGADHVALQRRQGGDRLFRTVVPGGDRQGRGLRAGPSADARRGRRQADAPVDDGGGRLRRRAVQEQGRRLRVREIPDRPAGGEDPGGRRPPDAVQQERSTTTRRSPRTPTLQAFRKQVDVAIPMPNLAEMTMVWSPATTAMNTITKKAATPQAALDAAQKKVEADIAGLRKHP